MPIPQKCRYWKKGNCWREETCLYLHNDDDFNSDSDQSDHDYKVHDVHDDDEHDTESKHEDLNDMTTEENTIDELTAEDTTNYEINEEIRATSITTEEILRMYESDPEENNHNIHSKLKKTTQKKTRILKE